MIIMLAVHVVNGLMFNEHNLHVMYVKLAALELNSSERTMVVILNVTLLELSTAHSQIHIPLLVSMKELRSMLYCLSMSHHNGYIAKSSSFFDPLSNIPLTRRDAVLVSRTMTGGLLSSTRHFFGGGIGLGGVGVLLMY